MIIHRRPEYESQSKKVDKLVAEATLPPAHFLYAGEY